MSGKALFALSALSGFAAALPQGNYYGDESSTLEPSSVGGGYESVVPPPPPPPPSSSSTDYGYGDSSTTSDATNTPQDTGYPQPTGGYTDYTLLPPTGTAPTVYSWATGTGTDSHPSSGTGYWPPSETSLTYVFPTGTGYPVIPPPIPSDTYTPSEASPPGPSNTPSELSPPGPSYTPSAVPPPPPVCEPSTVTETQVITVTVTPPAGPETTISPEPSYSDGVPTPEPSDHPVTDGFPPPQSTSDFTPPKTTDVPPFTDTLLPPPPETTEQPWPTTYSAGPPYPVSNSSSSYQPTGTETGTGTYWPVTIPTPSGTGYLPPPGCNPAEEYCGGEPTSIQSSTTGYAESSSTNTPGGGYTPEQPSTTTPPPESSTLVSDGYGATPPPPPTTLPPNAYGDVPPAPTPSQGNTYGKRFRFWRT